MWSRRATAGKSGMIGIISAIILFGCATHSPKPGQGDPPLSAQGESPRAGGVIDADADINSLLYEAFRSRARAEDTARVAVQTIKDPARLMQVRQAYTAAAATGNALLEAYKATIEEKLFQQPAVPSTGPSLKKLVEQMLKDEESLNKLVYANPAVQSVQAVAAVIDALNGVYKLVWGWLSDRREAQQKDKQAYLDRVRTRVDEYRWHSWDKITNQPSPASGPSGQ